MTNSIIFGPVPSRRFGISLGIDLSPTLKQCNFDCLYCELAPAKTISTMSEFPKVDFVIEELKKALEQHKNIDVITITCNGEPTLYPFLDELVDRINAIKGNLKTLILSNGSTIYKKEIFDTLLKIDTVKLSLDCVSKNCFKKLDRYNRSVEIEKIVPSMVEFSKKKKNSFVIEVLFIENLNDNIKETELLYEVLTMINPARVDIGTIDRPPAYKVNAVSFEFLESIAKKFANLNVNIVYKNRPSSIQHYTKEEILNTLEKRPLTLEDIENMFDDSSKNILENLLQAHKIELVDVNRVKFYKKVKKD